jgi:hypothetical protein
MSENSVRKFSLILALVLIIFAVLNPIALAAEYTKVKSVRAVGGLNGGYYVSDTKTFEARVGKWFDALFELSPSGSGMEHSIKIVIENQNPASLKVNTTGYLDKSATSSHFFTSLMLESVGSADIVIKEKDGTEVGRFKVKSYSNEQESETAGTVKVTGIKVTQKTLEISVGQSVTVNAEVVPANATENRYSWSVDNGDVIDIETNGRITGKSQGVAKVTAVSLEGQFQDTCTVTVKEAETGSDSKEPQKPESTAPMESEPKDKSGDTSEKDPPAGIITEDTIETIKDIGDNLNDSIKDLKANEAETGSDSKESQKPESTAPMESETKDKSGDTSEKDPLAGIITKDTIESIKDIGENLNDRIKDLKANEFFDNLKSYEDELVEKRLEKRLEPEDAARKQSGMEIFENAVKPEENEVQEKNKRAEKTTERLEKIAEKQGAQLEIVEDADGQIRLERKDDGQNTLLGDLIYNLKTEQADKLIDKVFDKTIGALVKQLKKKKLMPDFLETGMGLFGRFFKDKKDELILTDDEQIQKVREEIGVSDDVSAELYLRNNQWSEKETGAGTWMDLITKNEAAEKFNKVLEEIVSLRKKDHANASKLEYELINREVNRLRMDGLSKEEAVKVIKNRYVYEYYDHYGLETKKSDGTWQDNVLQFLGLGGENRRFGGFNKDKMDVSSSEGYKDTGTRFDMIIEVMDNREDIYTDDDVRFIRKLRQEEGRE